MEFQDLTLMLKAVRVAAKKGDYEVAHSLEDDLLKKTLAYIASGNCSCPKEFAAAALKVTKIKFQRHCA